MFIGRNLHRMNALPRQKQGTGDEKGLALYNNPTDEYDVATYAENDNNQVSPIDDDVQTVYVDHAYFFSRTPQVTL